MSLFSDETKISVASSAYNLAGEWSVRTKLYQSTMAHALLTKDPKDPLGSYMVQSMLNGPRYAQRSFLRWATDNFEIGHVSGKLDSGRSLNSETVQDIIQSEFAVPISVSYAILDDADIRYWAEKYIIENRPEDYSTAWTMTHDEIAETITIQFGPGDTVVLPEAGLVPNYNYKKDYVVAYYVEKQPDVYVKDSEDAEITDLTSPPSLTAYDLDDITNEETEYVTLTKTTTVSVDDGVGEPEVTVTSETTDELFNRKNEIWVDDNFESADLLAGTETYSRERLLLKYRYNVITSTSSTVSTDTELGTVTTTTIEQEIIDPIYHTQLSDWTITKYPSTGDSGVFIYMVGSGNTALDALKGGSIDMEEFFPIIPLRVKNKAISHNSFDDIYDDVAEAFDRATGSDIEDVLDELDENPDIEDVDYAYLVHGIEANTQEKEGKRYIYEFLLNLIEHQSCTETQLEEFLEKVKKDNASAKDIPTVSSLKNEVGNNDFNLTYDSRLKWIYIKEEIKSGSERQVGKLWWDKAAEYEVYENFLEVLNGNKIEKIYLNWQTEDNRYRRLTIYGMTHLNYVYKSKRVKTRLGDALDDDDDSGFIFPLHRPTMISIPMVAQTQIAASSRLIVFNSVEITKIKWWQKGIFRIIAGVLISVVASLVIPGLGGILGTNLLVGTSLGLTGTAAIIAGAVVNALAAMAISYVINIGATALFGEKFGSIIGSIISMAVFSVMSGISSGLSLSASLTKLFSIDNLIKLTGAVADGVSTWVNSEIENLGLKLGDLHESYEDSMAEIEKKTAELLGYSGVHLDPLSLWKGLDNRMMMTESSTTFLNRTLLTGTDLAEISIDMIGDFTKLTLDLPDFRA